MKSFKFICLITLILMTTGCVKLEIGMDINKDKSMNISIVEAFNQELLDQTNNSIADEKELEKIKKDGYKIEKYEDESMSGYSFTKKIKNIDTISTKEKIEGNLAVGLGTNETTSKYLFTVKKGLFKNTYSAKLKASDANAITSQTKNETTETDENEETSEENNIDIDVTPEENEEIIDNNSDTENNETLMSGMEIQFTVNLPYQALSHNATSEDNNGKKLTWNLLTNENENIEFEFELYNMTNIYILIGLGAVLIIIMTLIIKRKNKKPKEITKIVNQLSSIQPGSIENMPSQPNAMNINVTSAKETKTEIENTKAPIIENPTAENPKIKENKDIEILDIEETNKKK